MSYDKVPSKCTLKLTPFTAHCPDKKLSDFKTLLELSPIAVPTYENTTRTDGQYGVTRKWAQDMKETWLHNYDWRKTEERINGFANFTVPIKAKDGEQFTMHFAALFSERADAVPVCLIHGWPGSFIEFLSFLEEAKKKWSAKDMPYHYIVPSMTGYAYSEGPSIKREWVNEDIAFVTNELMVGLGFGDGYVAHGGDIGSFISRICAVRYDACKAIHLNFCLMGEEPANVTGEVNAHEKDNLKRLTAFLVTGNAYAKEHGTKGGTIGLVLSASPLALLCWVGEKYIEWTDQTPSDQDILDSVMLYWVTDTFPRCIYPYIDFFGRGDESTVFHPHPDYFCKKPIGFSYFPYELGPIPLAWAKTTGNIVWHREHKTVSISLYPTVSVDSTGRPFCGH